MKRLFKITLAVAFLLCLGNVGWAQNRTVTGSVSDQDGISLPGVTVIEKGTTNGTVTNIDGKFSISVPVDAEVLQFSFVGMKLQEVVLGSSSTYNVSMEQDAIGIEEVVAIGYGSMKKSDLTGAVASVQSEDILRASPTQAVQAIQGQVAGVTITKSNARPGATYDVNIRGLNSIDYDNTPLYVIDGVMGGDMNALNPADIKSIDVLKDASSTAIYGSRGANGVVIVTTKRGSKGKPQVSYNGYVGVKLPAHLPDFQNAEEFYQRCWVDAETNGYSQSYTLTSTEEARLDAGQTTDWLGEITGPSLQTNHSISVGGGNESTSYHFSTGYLDEGGSMQETQYQRYNIKASLDSKINKMVKVGFTSNYSYSKQELGSNEAIRSAYRARPTGAIYYDDVLNPTENNEEDWNGYACWMGIDDSQVLNPVIEADPENFQDETRTSTFTGNAYVEFTPIEGLSVKSQISTYISNSRWGQYRGTYTKSRKTSLDPQAYYRNTMNSTYTLDNIISYTKDFGEHNISFSAIQSAYQYRNEYIYAKVSELAYESLWYAMGTSDTYDELETNLTEKTILSYMARMIYGFKDNRYMLTLTTRWDGASQLSEGNKWDYFPSAAVAWRISDEPFMESLDKISSAKLRVSYGFVGNSSVSAYATQATLSQTAYDFDGDDAYGFAPSGLADSELQWEKSREINIGLDFGLFNNRITSTLELYKRNTVDLIYDEQLPSSSGYTEVTTNVGEVSNKGIEFLLNTVNVKTSRFSWSTSLNFSKNINEIVSLGDGIEQDISSGLFVGEALNVHYYYQMDGLWQEDEATEAANYSLEPGAVKVIDQNDDGEITSDDDRVIIGGEQPDWIGGITNKFTFDNFDFSFMIYTSQGAMYKNSMLSGTMGNVGKGRYNALNLNMWTYDNPGGTWSPYGISNTYRSALYYQDASYIRISDITLGYTVPRSILDRWGISHARLYAQVSNPFIFTKWDGMDPEYNTSLYGDDVPSMSVMFGMNITF